MLKIYIISPFPEILKSILSESMLKKAVERNKVEYIRPRITNFFKTINS